MRITFNSPSGKPLSRPTELLSGWNLQDGFGIKLYPSTGLVVWNSLPNAGVRTIGPIVIDFDRKVNILPCWKWRVEHIRSGFLRRAKTRLTIGEGVETFGPRAGLRVRWGWPKAAPTGVHYDGVWVKWHAKQATPIYRKLASDMLVQRDVGMWPVRGERYPSPPGAYDRNGCAGWEQDAWGMVLRSDLTMNRMPVGSHDPVTGEPMYHKDDSYNLVRGWGDQYGKGNQHRMWRDENGKPLRGDRESPGPYEAIIVGTNRWNGYLPLDGEHGGMATGVVRAAAQCSDPIAQDDMAVLAMDCYMAGNSMLGGRSNAWSIDAEFHSRRTRIDGGARAAATVTRQMPSGAFQRAEYPYPFSPSPWDVYGMDPKHDARQHMEEDITNYALGLYGHREAIQRNLKSRRWPSTAKFSAVAERKGAPYAEAIDYRGSGDYFPWLSLGVAAWLDLDVPWMEWALTQPTPGGAICDDLHELRDQLQREVYGKEQTAMMLAKLWEVT